MDRSLRPIGVVTIARSGKELTDDGFTRAFACLRARPFMFASLLFFQSILFIVTQEPRVLEQLGDFGDLGDLGYLGGVAYGSWIGLHAFIVFLVMKTLRASSAFSHLQIRTFPGAYGANLVTALITTFAALLAGVLFIVPGVYVFIVTGLAPTLCYFARQAPFGAMGISRAIARDKIILRKLAFVMLVPAALTALVPLVTFLMELFESRSTGVALADVQLSLFMAIPLSVLDVCIGFVATLAREFAALLLLAEVLSPVLASSSADALAQRLNR